MNVIDRAEWLNGIPERLAKYQGRVYASMIISNGNGQFLTIDHPQRPGKNWSFAGGKVEPGEALLAALVREAKEELGIDIISASLKTEHEVVVQGVDWLGYFFLVEAYAGTPRIMEPAKHTQIRWMTRFELLSECVSPEASAVSNVWL